MNADGRIDATSDFNFESVGTRRQEKDGRRLGDHVTTRVKENFSPSQPTHFARLLGYQRTRDKMKQGLIHLCFSVF